MKDYYKDLGLPPSATQIEIKSAYRRLSNIHHPDKGGDIRNFQRINEAYETLSDQSRKFEYDKGINSLLSIQDIPSTAREILQNFLQCFGR